MPQQVLPEVGANSADLERESKQPDPAQVDKRRKFSAPSLETVRSGQARALKPVLA